MVAFPHDVLIALSEKNNQKVLRFITEENLNSSDDHGRTLLHYAAAFSNIELVSYLLGRGSRVDAVDQAGSTPLLLAISNSVADDCVEKLLEAGANVNATTVGGNSPLRQTFAGNSSNRVIQLVLMSAEAGTPMHQLAVNLIAARCPAYHAVQLQNSRLLANLAALGMPLDERDPVDGFTAVHVAALLADLRSMEVLLHYGANAHAEDDRGRGVFYHLYCERSVDHHQQQQCLEIARRLREAHVPADPDRLTKDGEGELSHLFKSGCVEAIELLFNAVHQANYDDEDNNLAHLLARNKNLGIREFVIAHAEELGLGAVNANGETPLWCAARSGNLEVLVCLLHFNVDPNFRTRLGFTPLLEVIAIPNVHVLPSHSQCVRFLIRNDADAGIRVRMPDNLEYVNIVDIAEHSGNEELLQVAVSETARLEATTPGSVPRHTREIFREHLEVEAFFQIQVRNFVISDLLENVLGNVLVDRIMALT